MPRYEFSAFASAIADTPEQAREAIEAAFYRRDPDAPRVSLDDGEPVIAEDGEYE